MSEGVSEGGSDSKYTTVQRKVCSIRDASISKRILPYKGLLNIEHIACLVTRNTLSLIHSSPQTPT